MRADFEPFSSRQTLTSRPCCSASCLRRIAADSPGRAAANDHHVVLHGIASLIAHLPRGQAGLTSETLLVQRQREAAPWVICAAYSAASGSTWSA